MRRLFIILTLVICHLSFVFAAPADSAKVAKKAAVKSHLKQHFKPYGFIRNYFTYDSRESWSGTGDMHPFMAPFAEDLLFAVENARSHFK